MARKKRPTRTVARRAEKKTRPVSRIPTTKSTAGGASTPQESEPDPVTLGANFPIVAIGASAGGLEAYTTFLKAVPPDTGMGFVLIQHMDPSHDSILGTLLQRSTRMPVREAADGTVVEPNSVYIMPPNSLMTISEGTLSVTSRGPRSYTDYPIDQFFVSLAHDLKHRAIGVVLSGTASDGTRGLMAIKAEGGITFAQDIETAQFSSMPASAIASGCVDFTLPPNQIALELPRIHGHPYIRRTPVSEAAADVVGGDGIRKILRQLRLVAGVDFELYKPAMIRRRIARRMAVHKLETLEQYAALIKKDRAELNALYEDIFIHVTGFFRDPESLLALQKRVLAGFMPGKTSRTIRIWVPGCSSGEEVYSIAMLLFEVLGERRTDATIHIFGTDISEKSIQKARLGIYSAASMVDVAPKRQRRFFSGLDGNFQIIKAIRDVCVFAKHDLGKDPPFSRMDLISCRNVLIYMGPVLQKRVIEAFHYALKPGGYLLLGKSESLTSYSSLFATEDAKHRILTRRALPSALHVHAGPPEKPGYENPVEPQRAIPAVSDMRREAELLLLDQYTPAALVVDSGLQIVHFQGNTGMYLSPASGEPSFHLLRMIKPELLMDMRTAIHQAKRENTTVHKTGIRFSHNGEFSTVDIHVSPIRPRHASQNDFLVVFQEHTKERAEKETKASNRTVKNRDKAELARKEQEIAFLREQLQELVQDHEAADEEVRSMNEEILSSNEELQSTNEELETAKEELESTNEELTTLNDELQKRNADLSQITDDLSNLLTAIDIPIVLLDGALHIRRFTPAAGRVLNIIGSDFGRPLSDIASTLTSVSWKEIIPRVVETGKAVTLEVQDRQGTWYNLRIRPYRSGSDRVDGVLVALQDVDLLKKSLEQATQARQRAEDLEARLVLAAQGLNIGMWELDLASNEVRGTKQWAALYGLPPEQSIPREQWLSRVHPDDRGTVRDDVDELIATGKISNLDYRVILPDGSTHWLSRRSELVRDEKGRPAKIRGVSLDSTDRKLVEQERMAFASRIASAQEGERRRIARELHDGLIQELAGMAMDLGRRAAEPHLPGERKQDFQQLQSRVIKAAEIARHVAYELHPSELDDLGLEKAMRAYCQQIAGESGIAVDFKCRKIPAELNRETASCLYKVAQEALRNVAKHAKAKQAKVVLESADSHIRLSISDGGKGFDVSLLQGDIGLGVASMRERVQLCNGKFNIASQRGAGTEVTAELPLQQPGKAK